MSNLDKAAHGRGGKVGLLLVNLGTPDEPTPKALRRYLGEFLSDPRVVEIPRLAWWFILHGIILRTRPAKSAAKYASVWTPEGSPLMKWTQAQSRLIEARFKELGGENLVVDFAMRYGNPSMASRLDAMREQGVDKILVMPLYPQYAGATSASAFDALAAWSNRQRWIPELRWVSSYHDDQGYIEALACKIEAGWARLGRPEKLVLSFHGTPERSLHLGDPYHCHCHKTARLLRERLGLAASDCVVSFQSRFGAAKWLGPYTEPTLRDLAAKGVRRVQVACPGFAVDCLETLEEIAMEAKHAFLEAGGERFDYIECLNDDQRGIAALANIAQRHLSGWNWTAAPSPDVFESRRRLVEELAAARASEDLAGPEARK